MAVLHDDVRAEAHGEARVGFGNRAFAVDLPTSPSCWCRAVEQAEHLGFDTMLALAGTATDPAAESVTNLAELAKLARAVGLRACVTISLDRVESAHPLAAAIAPECFSPAPPTLGGVIDPRQTILRSAAIVCLRRPEREVVVTWWREQISRLRDMGFDEAAIVNPSRAATYLAHVLEDQSWPVIAYTTSPKHDTTRLRFIRNDEPASDGWASGTLARVALESNGWALQEAAAAGAENAVRAVNRLLRGRALKSRQVLRHWTGPAAVLDIVSRPSGNGEVALVLVKNRGTLPVTWPPQHMPPMPWQKFSPIAGLAGGRSVIEPGEIRLFNAGAYVSAPSQRVEAASSAADPAKRIAITRVSPSVDGGSFAVKTVIAATIQVEADIFADGHEQLGAAVLLRAECEETWTRYIMAAQPNDVWTASIRTTRLGSYQMVIEAWIDVWGGFIRDLLRKLDAAQDVALEVTEARMLIEAALPHASNQGAADLRATLQQLNVGTTQDSALLLAAAPVKVAMAEVNNHRFRTRSFVQPITVEREAAQFSSWYELFPRSQGQDSTQHGHFADAAKRLPHIAAMGFDTVYFPPIHPIGEKNRKGPNNAVSAQPADVGSPYAIGSIDGGHDAIHRQLGTLADFTALVRTAREHGLEVALDFAIQCAPDHPWLTQHPGWFAWRPDGSIKYAENPPKKYQDIVNVDFYAADAIPDLWNALRDVVLFWAEQGVRSFRVDNPHTKPLPFWAWLIAQVKSHYPDTLFLSEAFTRPKPMYQLAKAGFSQSYTYFTWRNDKAELIDYINELTQTEVRNFFRPHLFVNTPDINPLFLQASGRPGFLIRAALAATLSGLWGVYAGFELCESAALPGREEYLDSEKYQLRPRPDRVPGDIVDEIVQLNRLRRAEPALQSHLGVTFHNAYNDKILYFSKAAPGQSARLLVSVSLDPHEAQEADVEIPLWLFGLADWETVNVKDLLTERQFAWSGKIQRLRMSPQSPYGIWRLTAPSVV